MKTRIFTISLIITSVIFGILIELFPFSLISWKTEEVEGKYRIINEYSFPNSGYYCSKFKRVNVYDANGNLYLSKEYTSMIDVLLGSPDE